MNKIEEDDGSSMGDENMFEVEKILAMKEEFGMRRYLIKWKNYDDSENSWEPEDNLSCPELLEQFKATVNKQPPPPTLRVKLGSLNSISNSSSATSTFSSSSKTVLPQKRSLSENRQTHHSNSKPDQIREESSSTPSLVDGSPTKKMSTEKFKSTSSPVLRIQNERLQQHTQRRETTSSSSISPLPPTTTMSSSSPSISSSSLSSSLALSSLKPSSLNSTTKHKSIPLAISRLRDPRLARQRQTNTTASPTTTTRSITSRPPPPTSTTSTISTPTTHSYPVDPNNDSKPISWRGNIIGNIEPSADIQMISVPAKCPRSTIVNEFLQSSERSNGGHKTLRLTAFIKLKVLERFFNAARVCLLDLNHAGSNQIGYGKLARFLMVNEVAGLVHLNDRPTDVLAVVHCTDKLASGWKLGFRSNKTLLGIFLEDMPKYPQFPRSTIELKDWPLLKSSSIKTYDWQLLLTSLQFPPQLIKVIHQETHMEIFGTSLWANMLQNAHNFDRSDDSIFKTNLYKYKRSNWNTTFWQFGISNPSFTIIPSPTESFPRNSANTVDTLNRHPLTLSKWRFVLKDDLLTQLKTRTKGVKDAQKIQAAIVNLSILFSQDKCEIMRNWMIDNTKYPNESTATVKWAEKIVRRYHEEHEYFVLVDDIGTMKSHLGCLDRSSSRDLLNLFSVPSPSD
ncbi:hypothetical protein INT45_000542 [Circinella minor]|uniref:Chromo domain-containing protein n=1 Tax=Circinella minor TaxID=1195481 RepID=A0A8H7VTC6_9FUNG|nr:hypothetical protein INT45_000542 [Circinella minor]